MTVLLGYVFAGRRETTTTRKKGQGLNCLVELWFLLGEWPGVLVCLFYAAVCEISSSFLLSESAKIRLYGSLFLCGFSSYLGMK